MQSFIKTVLSFSLMVYLETAEQTTLLVYLAIVGDYSGYLWSLFLVYMHHSIEESPEEDISEKTSDEASSEEQPSGFEAFVPPPSGLEDEQERQEKGGEEVKNEAIQSRQPEDASCCSGQSGHRGAAVVQHASITPHGQFADELWTLALGYNSCHVGTGGLSQKGVAVRAESQTRINWGVDHMCQAMCHGGQRLQVCSQTENNTQDDFED